jgi:hypothetical protein
VTGHEFDLATGLAKQLLARHRGCENRDVMAALVQRVREFQRVHDAAARVHRMGEQRDAHRLNARSA